MPPPLGMASGLGLGVPRAATSSGSIPAAVGGFKITIRDTEANLEARTGDDVGTIAFITSGTHQYDVVVYDGYAWQTYNNA